MTRKPILIAALIGLAAAALLFALASRRIEAQGLYQDEVFQAAGSFSYVGQPCVAALCARGVPLLSGPYEGGIKAGLYGLYLRITGRPFTAVSWRMLGILSVAAGLVAFALLVYRALPPIALAAGLLLLVTDCTAILTTRHDWGPTALALVLRLLVIAMLAREVSGPRSARWNNFITGLLVGVALFEKPSALVLFAPLALALAFEPLRRRPGAVATLALGGLIGASPAIVANGFTYLHDHTIIFLSAADASQRPPFREFVRDFPDAFLSLGAGGFARSWILGDTDSAREAGREIALMAALLGTSLAIAGWKFRQGREFRNAALFGLSVFGVAAVLYAMPRRTALHHHIQAIPFTYLAGASALAGLARLKRPGAAEKAAAGALGAVMILLLANHAAAVVEVERDLAEGRAGAAWDPVLTRLGEFGASQRQGAVFLLTDWGVATQMYCLAQGQPEFVHEVFWNYAGAGYLEQAAGASKTVYLVTPARTVDDTQRSARIVRDAEAISTWRELPVEPQAAALAPAIVVRKFRVEPRP